MISARYHKNTMTFYGFRLKDCRNDGLMTFYGFRLKDCRNDGMSSLFVIPAVLKPESRCLQVRQKMRHKITK
ncbi:MAG: hypothetical protein C4576_29280 [Desulfobacteraceae bacterium]|nr:MAG: hypothetical protein C4576_29280 [Desulfobacteraceae bacterium]